MYRCVRCDRDVWEIDPKGICRLCQGTADVVFRPEAAARLTEVPAHCHAVIEEVGYLSPGGAMQLGDLYLTSGGVVYVPLASAQLAHGQGATTGLLAGGLVGGIIGAVSDAAGDSDRRSIAQRQAAAERNDDYGLPIQERIRKRGGLVIPTASIRSLASDPARGALQIIHDGGSLALATALPESRQRLVQRLIDGIIQDEPDRWAINTSRPGVSALLEALEAGRADEHTLSLAAADPILIDRLCSAFDRLKRSRQQAITEAMVGVPTDLRDHLGSHLHRQRPAARRRLILAILGVALIAPILILVACLAPGIDWSSTELDDTTTAFGLSLVFLLFIAPAMVFFLIRAAVLRRHLEAMIRRLKHP